MGWLVGLACFLFSLYSAGISFTSACACYLFSISDCWALRRVWLHLLHIKKHPIDRKNPFLWPAACIVNFAAQYASNNYHKDIFYINSLKKNCCFHCTFIFGKNSDLKSVLTSVLSRMEWTLYILLWEHEKKYCFVGKDIVSNARTFSIFKIALGINCIFLKKSKEYRICFVVLVLLPHCLRTKISFHSTSILLSTIKKSCLRKRALNIAVVLSTS